MPITVAIARPIHYLIIKNGTKAGSRKLLEAFGMPFEKKESK